ncbi:MAG: lactate utilization protein [Planctomycetia bacterium]|nr:lactate utilization protein [Planctomycetia bacterium]
MTAGGDTTARDTILARVREALRVPAPLPHMKSHAAVAAAPAGPDSLTILPVEVARPWLPDGGETAEERLAILTENLGKLRAEVQRAADLTAAAAQVAALVRERGWKRVAWHTHPAVEPVAATLGCDSYRLDSTSFDKDALEACDAGITACDAAIAQTGSILVSSASCGGRALSILPHVHIVIVTLDQIVATLGDALDAIRTKHAGRMPSMLSFITGPSRTGDIERILVLGAHGPKELFVILVG